MSVQTQPVVSKQPTTMQQRFASWKIALGGIVAVLLIGLILWGVIWLAQNKGPEIQAVRDIFIIMLAMSSCLFGLVLLILLMMVIRLVNMLEFEIKPILEKTNETVGMVRGTTVFVSQNVVKPVTLISSYIAGIRRGVSTLIGDPKKNLSD